MTQVLPEGLKPLEYQCWHPVSASDQSLMLQKKLNYLSHLLWLIRLGCKWVKGRSQLLCSPYGLLKSLLDYPS